jgi:plasmid stabilization system protein ParE
MSLRFNLTPHADQDIEEAVAWYDEQVPALGSQFLRALRSRFQEILWQPELFRPFGRRGLRKARILHWPYSVFFRVVQDELRIVAVWHGARDPKELNYRLR